MEDGNCEEKIITSKRLMAIIVLVVTLTAYSKISNVKIPYLSGHRI